MLITVSQLILSNLVPVDCDICIRFNDETVLWGNVEDICNSKYKDVDIAFFTYFPKTYYLCIELEDEYPK